jgi:glycosyltransferase involved in cell wall biosynthesis
MTPRASVIMPFVGEVDYIGAAIESVRRQDRPDWELILIDDGSTDGSRAIADAAAAADPARIRVLAPDPLRKGAAAARNRGIAAARGDYLVCLDADDLFDPDKLSAEIPLISAHPEVAMLYGPTRWFWQDRRFRRVRTERIGVAAGTVYPPPVLLSRVILSRRGAVPSVCGVMLRRDAVLAVGGFDERFRLYEDQTLWVKLFLTRATYVSAGCHASYRQHARSTSARAVESGEYRAAGPHEAHRRFLDWVAATVAEAGIRDPALDAALAAQRSYYADRPVTLVSRIRDRITWRFGL